jgi:hypothetical protein
MRKSLFIAAIIAVILTSCIFNQKKQNSEIIPENVMVNILVDMYKLEGVFSTYSIRREFTDESISVLYDSIFSKYNYTRAQFINSIKQYCVEVETFDRIYDNVIKELNKLEVESLSSTAIDSIENINIWNQQVNWNFPEECKHDSIPFCIPIKGIGEYRIAFTIKFLKKDETINPRVKAYFWYDNGTPEGYRDYFEYPIVKTDAEKNIFVSKKNLSYKVTHLKGWLLYSDYQQKNWTCHAKIKDIKINYKYLRD